MLGLGCRIKPVSVSAEPEFSHKVKHGHFDRPSLPLCQSLLNLPVAQLRRCAVAVGNPESSSPFPALDYLASDRERGR
jgi:hypothetical protein